MLYSPHRTRHSLSSSHITHQTHSERRRSLVHPVYEYAVTSLRPTLFPTATRCLLLSLPPADLHKNGEVGARRGPGAIEGGVFPVAVPFTSSRGPREQPAGRKRGERERWRLCGNTPMRTEGRQSRRQGPRFMIRLRPRLHARCVQQQCRGRQVRNESFFSSVLTDEEPPTPVHHRCVCVGET